MYILHQSAIKTPHFKWRPSFSILSNRRSEYPCHMDLNPARDPDEIEVVAKIHVLFMLNLLRRVGQCPHSEVLRLDHADRHTFSISSSHSEGSLA